MRDLDKDAPVDWNSLLHALHAVEELSAITGKAKSSRPGENTDVLVLNLKHIRAMVASIPAVRQLRRRQVISDDTYAELKAALTSFDAGELAEKAFDGTDVPWEHTLTYTPTRVLALIAELLIERDLR